MFRKMIATALVSAVLAGGHATTSFAQGCGDGEPFQYSAAHRPKSLTFRPITEEERDAEALKRWNRFLNRSPVKLPENANRAPRTRAERINHWVNVLSQALDR
jgi:hypothetical protein